MPHSRSSPYRQASQRSLLDQYSHQSLGLDYSQLHIWQPSACTLRFRCFLASVHRFDHLCSDRTVARDTDHLFCGTVLSYALTASLAMHQCFESHRDFRNGHFSKRGVGIVRYKFPSTLRRTRAVASFCLMRDNLRTRQCLNTYRLCLYTVIEFTYHDIGKDQSDGTPSTTNSGPAKSSQR